MKEKTNKATRMSINFRCSAEDRKVLEAVAAEKGLTITHWIRYASREAYKKLQK